MAIYFHKTFTPTQTRELQGVYSNVKTKEKDSKAQSHRISINYVRLTLFLIAKILVFFERPNQNKIF